MAKVGRNVDFAKFRKPNKQSYSMVLPNKNKFSHNSMAFSLTQKILTMQGSPVLYTYIQGNCKYLSDLVSNPFTKGPKKKCFLYILTTKTVSYRE